MLGSESVGGVLCRSGSVASSGDAALAKARGTNQAREGSPIRTSRPEFTIVYSRLKRQSIKNQF